MLIIWLMLLHWLGDFVLQTDWMAVHKASDRKALFTHIGVYGATMFTGLFSMFGFSAIWFVLLNAILHGIIDYVTSKASHYCNDTGDRHNMFVMIGLDQFVHFVFLYLTMGMLTVPVIEKIFL